MSAENCPAICERLGRAIKNLVALHAAEGRSIPGFVAELLNLEQETIRPAGLILTGANTIDDWTCFTLHVAATGRVCARFECRPETGEFRDGARRANAKIPNTRQASGQ